MPNEVQPRLREQPVPSVFRLLSHGLLLTLVLLVLTGCFQSAGDGLMPTTVDLTALASLSAPTAVPFVTPLPAQGFTPPTISSVVTPTEQPNTPLTGFSPTPVPNTEASATLPDDLPTTILLSPIPLTPVPTGDTSSTNPAPDNPASNLAPTNLPTTNPQAVNVSGSGLATPTVLATDLPCVHTVQPNEWLYKIAEEYKIDPAQLIAANPKAVNRILQPGDTINIPGCNKPGTGTTTSTTPDNSVIGITPLATDNLAALTPTVSPTYSGPPPTPIPLTNHLYTVANGDTLDKIAHKFNISLQALRNANQLTSDFLSIGQQLIIPTPVQN